MAEQQKTKPDGWLKSNLLALIVVCLQILTMGVGFGVLKQTVDDLKSSLAAVRDQMVQKDSLDEKMKTLNSKIDNVQAEGARTANKVDRIEERMLDDRARK